MKQFVRKITAWTRTFFRETFHSENRELPYYVVTGIALAIFVAALKGFIEITDELAENQLESFDQGISDFVVSFRDDSLTAFFRFMTEMGDWIAYTVISLVLGGYFIVRHRSWKFIVQTLSVLLLATASNVLIKHIIHRTRPTAEHLVVVNSLSYPSGHSMSAMAFYGFLIYLTMVSKMSFLVRCTLAVVLAANIFLIGLSRIYLGVHFPSDVAAGFIGGLIWVTLCIMVFNIFSLLRKRRTRTIVSPGVE